MYDGRELWHYGPTVCYTGLDIHTNMLYTVVAYLSWLI